MRNTTIEERLAALEAELARLKSKVDAMEDSRPWWERIAGRFEGDVIYLQAMKLGRQYRRSSKPSTSKKK